MIIKIAVDGGHNDCHQQPWLSPEAALQTAVWTERNEEDPHSTRYATLEIAGWQVEFHEFREYGLDNKWLLVRREADKLGPACREAKIHLRDPNVGGTLVLKLKKKRAEYQFLYGDRSMMLGARNGGIQECAVNP